MSQELGLEDIALAYMGRGRARRGRPGRRHHDDGSRSMTWLLWRQHRAQGAVAGIALAAYAILLWITGVHMANDYHSALASCGATTPATT